VKFLAPCCSQERPKNRRAIGSARPCLACVKLSLLLLGRCRGKMPPLIRVDRQTISLNPAANVDGDLHPLDRLVEKPGHPNQEKCICCRYLRARSSDLKFYSGHQADLTRIGPRQVNYSHPTRVSHTSCNGNADRSNWLLSIASHLAVHPIERRVT